MTKLEYLIFLRKNKGFLFKEESRLDEVIEGDREDLLKQRYIEVEGNIVFLTALGEIYLNSVE